MTERPLDRNSPIPLYFQIAENLKQAIEDGTLKPGERLDNELDLTERLGVSRPTVRQAVQRLVEQGLVVRRRGLGTVVVAPRILRSVALTSLYDDLSASHRHPATTVLAAREIQADDELASVLTLPAGAAVLSVERLRLADGTPLAIMHNYLPAGLLKGRPEDVLEKTGLYELLRNQSVELHAGEQVIGARHATAHPDRHRPDHDEDDVRPRGPPGGARQPRLPRRPVLLQNDPDRPLKTLLCRTGHTACPPYR